jgi:PAS domain S-box-containing protein
MFEADISQMLQGTADAGFGVTLEGEIRMWNPAAEEFFGCSAAAVVGLKCCDVVCDCSESRNPICQPDCAVLQRAAQGFTTPAFDVEVKTESGTRWASMSIILVPARRGAQVLHLARDVQARKQVENMTRRFLKEIGAISGLKVEELLSPAAAPHVDLTAQQTAILRLLAEGTSTHDISDALHVSPATVRNHIEHILQKLQAHSRLEAVLRAIREKLV